MEINLSGNSRVFVTGKTGSGKTFLVSHLVKGIRRLVVLDPKGTLADWNLEPYGPESLKALHEGEPVKIRVVPDFGQDPAALWDEAMGEVYAAGHCTLYIDEIYAIVPPGQRASPALNAIWTRGREFGIGAWAASQRPSWCPLFVMSEADHYFVFRLTMKEDRARVAAFCGEEVLTRITDKHGFYYSAAIDDSPIYVRQLEA